MKKWDFDLICHTSKMVKITKFGDKKALFWDIKLLRLIGTKSRKIETVGNVHQKYLWQNPKAQGFAIGASSEANKAVIAIDEVHNSSIKE